MARFIIKDHDVEGREKDCCDCACSDAGWVWCEVEDRPCECRCHDNMAEGDYEQYFRNVNHWFDI